MHLPTDSILIQLEPGPERVTVRVAGELDLATAPDLAAALDTAMVVGVDVVVDLERLEFMDCSGLRVLLHAAGRSRDGGVPLAVSAVSHQVQRLLELSETADTFRIVQPR